MNPGESNFEENLKRLLKASCGPEVDVTPAARERLRAELACMRRPGLQPAEFPESVLGFLTVLVLLLFAAWAVCARPGAIGVAEGVLNGPILALVGVNLISIPVASLVIVLRRKYA